MHDCKYIRRDTGVYKQRPVYKHTCQANSARLSLAWFFALKSAVVTTLLFQVVFCSLLRLLDFRLQIFGETEATFCLTPEGSTRSPLVLLRGFGFAGVLSISTARFFILIAAFSSRSITSPQCGHLWVRTLRDFGAISRHSLQA